MVVTDFVQGFAHAIAPTVRAAIENSGYPVRVVIMSRDRGLVVFDYVRAWIPDPVLSLCPSTTIEPPFHVTVQEANGAVHVLAFTLGEPASEVAQA